jgi:hypothetical protein
LRRAYRLRAARVGHLPADSLTMTLKIFLDDKSFHCLKQSIPPGSRSKSIIEKAVHLDLFGSNAVLSCEEAEARNLLLYAGHCPGVIASIHNAFRAAGSPNCHLMIQIFVVRYASY